MRLLLDTHIWLWMLIEPGRLKTRLAHQLRDPDNELWLSPISVWESLVLAERQQIELAGEAITWVRTALQLLPLRDAPLTREVAIESRRLQLEHNDPVDRFLAASAIVHELRLATADHRLISAPAVPTVANR